MKQRQLLRTIASPRPHVLGCLAVLLAACAGWLQPGALARAPGARTAKAGGQPALGISDNSAALFRDPRFRWLGVRVARIVVPWDLVRRPRELAWDSAWLQAARSEGVRPLVVFNGDPSHPRRLPSLAAYTSATESLMSRFPWVLDYTPWNSQGRST